MRDTKGGMATARRPSSDAAMAILAMRVIGAASQAPVYLSCYQYRNDAVPCMFASERRVARLAAAHGAA